MRIMQGDQLYQIMLDAVDAGKTVLFYVPWPFYRGWANIKVAEAMTLTRGRSEPMEVDIDSEGDMLYIHAGSHN